MTLDEFEAFCTSKGIKWRYCTGHLGVKRRANVGPPIDVPDPSLRYLIAISIYAKNPWNDNKLEWFTLSSLAPGESAIEHAVEVIGELSIDKLLMQGQIP